jgi:hypothetical protein
LALGQYQISTNEVCPLKQNLQEFIGECECTDDFILMIIATESRGP